MRVSPPFDTTSLESEIMTKELEKLLETAKSVKMSAADREAQRRSFAYGNTKIENERITKEMIDEEADLNIFE